MFLLLQAGSAVIELVFILFFFALGFIVPLAVSWLIYRDAKQRNDDNALIWGLASFFGGICVWILYAVVRE